MIDKEMSPTSRREQKCDWIVFDRSACQIWSRDTGPCLHASGCQSTLMLHALTLG
jgi:hypothetical protein